MGRCVRGVENEFEYKFKFAEQDSDFGLVLQELSRTDTVDDPNFVVTRFLDVEDGIGEYVHIYINDLERTAKWLTMEREEYLEHTHDMLEKFVYFIVNEATSDFLVFYVEYQ